MLLTPVLLGALSTDLGLWTTVSVFVAWFSGYFAFFAFGLAARARAGVRRRRYLEPVFVYGGLSTLGAVVALYREPGLIAWALAFVPLVGLALVETWRGRPRSLLSGVATAVASTLMLPVLSGSPMQWWCAAFTGLYFAGTIAFVKTMIRERGNRGYLLGSICYHAVALLATVGIALQVGWVPGAAMILTMAAALFRSWAIPRSSASGRTWTPKMVGQAEIPLLLLLILSVCLAL